MNTGVGFGQGACGGMSMDAMIHWDKVSQLAKITVCVSLDKRFQVILRRLVKQVGVTTPSSTAA